MLHRPSREERESLVSGGRGASRFETRLRHLLRVSEASTMLSGSRSSLLCTSYTHKHVLRQLRCFKAVLREGARRYACRPLRLTIPRLSADNLTWIFRLFAQPSSLEEVRESVSPRLTFPCSFPDCRSGLTLPPLTGLMATQALAANGAKVYIIGRRKEALDNVVKNYSDVEGKIVP